MCVPAPREGEFTFTDSDGKIRTGRRKLLPVVTVRGGELFYPTDEKPRVAARIPIPVRLYFRLWSRNVRVRFQASSAATSR